MDIELFLNKKEDEVYMTEMANQFAIKNNDSVVGIIGDGNFGYAFKTKENKVIKVTKDPAEVFSAYKIKDKNLQNTTNIYDIDFIDDTNTIIYQEYTPNDPEIREQYFRVKSLLSLSDQCFLSFDETLFEEFNVKIDDLDLKFAKDIANGVNEVFNSGGFAYDVHEDNIGINKNGDFVIFDQKDIHEDQAFYKNKLKEIKEQENKIKPSQRKRKI